MCPVHLVYSIQKYIAVGGFVDVSFPHTVSLTSLHRYKLRYVTPAAWSSNIFLYPLDTCSYYEIFVVYIILHSWQLLLNLEIVKLNYDTEILAFKVKKIKRLEVMPMQIFQVHR